MIQRIQTIYLLVAAGLFTGSYFLPFAHANVAPEATIELTGVLSDRKLDLNDSQIALACVMVAAIFCLIAIFRYAQRLRQISMTVVGLLGAFIGAGTMAYLYFQNKGALIPDFGGLAVMAGMLCMLLAVRAIRKDENLVKSMDRLR